MPTRFVAPKRIDTLEDVRKALQLVQEQFDANGISRARQQLLTTSSTLRAGEFVRVSPRQGQTLTLKLPKASADNIGQRIEISIERPNGTVKIAAEAPDTVSELKTASFTLAGLVLLESNGVDQWVLQNQLPTNSPGSFVFSNSNNVTFGSSTGTGPTTITASASDVRFGLFSVVATSIGSATRMVVTTSPTIDWLATTGADAITIAASWRGMTISAGTVTGRFSGVTFSNANNVTFGMGTNGIVTASVTVASTQASIRLQAGTTSILSSLFSFADSNNVSFGLNTNGVMTATASDVRLGLVALPATNGNNVTALGILNSPSLTWSATTGVGGITIQPHVVSTAPFLALVSHVGGNSQSNVTRLAFSNASNVTWSLATAAGAVTVLASVATAAAGGIALADVFGNTISAGTAVLSQGTNSTISNIWSAGDRSNNILFGIAGSTVTGIVHMRAATNSAGNGSVFTRLNFEAGNGVTFGLGTVQGGNAAGGTTGDEHLVVTASIAGPPVVSVWRNLSENDIAFQGVTNLASFCSVFPLGFQGPFVGDMTLNTAEFLCAGASTATTGTQWGVTFRGGLYSLVNSTQLSLINSFSTATSSASLNSTRSSSYNNLFAGARWLTVGTGAWSAQPVLSAGVQYWMALVASISGSNMGPASVAIQRFPAAALPGMNGVMGSSQNATRAVGLFPFLGQISTGGIPNTIGTAGFITTTGAQMMMFPVLQFRNGVALGN